MPTQFGEMRIAVDRENPTGVRYVVAQNVSHGHYTPMSTGMTIGRLLVFWNR